MSADVVPELEVDILGPVTVRVSGRPITVTALMQRAVLAALALRGGTSVSVAELAADLWGDSPPASAMATLRNYVRRLRTVLPAGSIGSGAGGYRLAVRPDKVDALRLAGLADRARSRSCLATYEEALSLWRGSPMSDLGGVPLRTAQAGRWADLWCTTLENAADLWLAEGEHTTAVARLADAAARHPGRERLAAQLMTALHRSGRSSEALAHYHRFRDHSVGEHGIEPGLALRDLQTAILRDAPELRLSEARRPPGIDVSAPLPAVPSCFTGRGQEIGELRDRIAAVAGGAAVRCVVYGPAGSGKSSLAMVVARQVADVFPDGVVYIDLRGGAPGKSPLSSAEVLARLVHRLGGPESEIEIDLNEVSRACRARMRGKRLLVLLDNAASAAQTEAVPGFPRCAVVITSRAPLPPVADHLHLGELPPPDAVGLLGVIAGRHRVDAEPAAAARLVEACGRLPLALRVIGSRVSLRPHWSLEEWAGLLSDRRTLLAQLRTGDVDVRASILVSLDALRCAAKRSARDAAAVFPLLGLVTAVHFTPALVAGSTGWPLDRAEEALDELLDAQLVYSPSPHRYVPYDLVSAAAKQLPTELDLSLDDALSWYVAAVRNASLATTGTRSDDRLTRHEAIDEKATLTFADGAEARSWLDRELPPLLDILDELRLSGHDVSAYVHLLLLSTSGYFNSQGSLHSATRLALMARHDDPHQSATALLQLAMVEGIRGHHQQARRLVDRVSAIGDPDPRTLLTVRLLRANLLAEADDQADVTPLLLQLAKDARHAGMRGKEAAALTNLAILRLRDDPLQALSLSEQALSIARDLGDCYRVAAALDVVLQSQLRLGNHHDVLRLASEAGEQVVSDRLGLREANHLFTVAHAYHELGQHKEARAAWARAVRGLTDIAVRARLSADQVFAYVVRDSCWLADVGADLSGKYLDVTAP
ncbi:hypothetical protein DMP23_09490 [Amycolatopsis sp. A1MSW2902]|uniref:AfsR/SARP family transcriptional regulator n=1 Tax=Amycolatopsis sp. A1MSW2902 TaxID=687413 RepID=UPI00307E9BE4